MPARVSNGDSFRDRFDRPILIVSTPRSGSTLLFETLAQAPQLFSLGDESHGVIENFSHLHPRSRGWHSNRLAAEDATPEVAEELARAFYDQLHDRDGNAPHGTVRMLEKTPKNALRVPFFDAIWLDAQFIYLYRDPRESLASMMEAWSRGGFRTYPRLPNWRSEPWSLLLVPGWDKLDGLPLEEIVAHQWAITTETLLADLEKLPRDRVRTVVYSALLANPEAVIRPLAASLDLSWDRGLGGSLPLSKTTVSAPRPGKWRAVEGSVRRVWPIIEAADERARAFVASRAK